MSVDNPHLHLHQFEAPDNRLFDAIALLDSLHILGEDHPILVSRAIRVIKHSLVLAKQNLCLQCDHGDHSNRTEKVKAVQQR